MPKFFSHKHEKTPSCIVVRQVMDGESLLEVRCEGCSGKGSLASGECRSSLIGALNGCMGFDRVRLKNISETEAQPPAVALIRDMTSLSLRARGLSQSFSRVDRKCTGCLKKAIVMEDRLVRGVATDLEAVASSMRSVEGAVLGERSRGKECINCIISLDRWARSFVGEFFKVCQTTSRALPGNRDPALYRKRVRSSKKGGGKVGDWIVDLDCLESWLSDSSNKPLDAVFSRQVRRRPGFSDTWIIPTVPLGARKVATRNINGCGVTLYQLPDRAEDLYQIDPPEYRMDPGDMKMAERARRDMMETMPDEGDLANAERVRSFVENRTRSLCESHGMDQERADFISSALARHTAGMGVMEYLMADVDVQDVFVDAPADTNRLYVNLSGDAGDGLNQVCLTNLVLGAREMDCLLSRIKQRSGRSLTEARPVLESDMPELNARVTAVGSPLSPGGSSLTLRRHSNEPWTLPRLVDLGSLSPEAAGLLSFLIDGRSTILVAGPRGAGKSSLLGALMLELPTSHRIITIEDTLELPVEKMRSSGYKVQPLQVRSSTGQTGEMGSEDALRVALRMGESALVLGEVRGREARTLYEAMRTGSAGSTVMGTIHGDSARGVYDRVVHDLNIPPASFRATDVVVLAGTVQPGGSRTLRRRLVEIAELDKSMSQEGSFDTMMSYSHGEDTQKESPGAFRRSPLLGRIASSWGWSLATARNDIVCRGRVRSRMVQISRHRGRKDLLGVGWVARSNNIYRSLLDGERSDPRGPDHGRVFREWDRAFCREVSFDA